MKKKLSTAALFSFIYLTLIQESFAQEIKITQPENTGVKVGGRTGSAIVQNVYNSVVTIIFSVATLTFIIMLIWGAFDILASGGNKDKIQGGRKRITTSIIGIVVLAMAFFIARIVGDIVGIKIAPSTQLKIPSLLEGGTGQTNSISGTAPSKDSTKTDLLKKK